MEFDKSSSSSLHPKFEVMKKRKAMEESTPGMEAMDLDDST